MTTPQQEEDNVDYKRVASILQQRMAEKVSGLEGELALLRENAEKVIGQLQELVQQKDAKIAELEDDKVADVPLPKKK